MKQQPVRRIYLKEFKAISRAILEYDDLNLLINHIVERICREFEVKGGAGKAACGFAGGQGQTGGKRV